MYVLSIFPIFYAAFPQSHRPKMKNKKASVEGRINTVSIPIINARREIGQTKD